MAKLPASDQSADDWTLYCSRDYAAIHGVPKTRHDLFKHAIIGGGGGKGNQKGKKKQNKGKGKKGKSGRKSQKEKEEETARRLKGADDVTKEREMVAERGAAGRPVAEAPSRPLLPRDEDE